MQALCHGVPLLGPPQIQKLGASLGARSETAPHSSSLAHMQRAPSSSHL